MDSRTMSAFLGTYLFLIIGVGVLTMIAWAKLFKKAGVGWWTIFIPVYGSYKTFAVAESGGLFFGIIGVSVAQSLLVSLVGNSSDSTAPILIISLICLIAEIVMLCVYLVRLAEVYGRGKGFAAGLFFLYPVFIMILAFGNTGYIYNSPGMTVSGTWKCPDCGRENPASRATCDYCGRTR